MDVLADVTEKVLGKMTWLQHLGTDALKILTHKERMNHLFLWEHVMECKRSKIEIFSDLVRELWTITSPDSAIHKIFGKAYLDGRDFLSVLDEDIASANAKLKSLSENVERDTLVNKYVVLTVFRAACKWSKLRSQKPKFKIVRDVVTAARESEVLFEDLFKDTEVLGRACEHSPELALVLIMTMTHEKQVTNRALFMKLIMIACQGAAELKLSEPSVDRAKTAFDIYKTLSGNSKDMEVAKSIGMSDTIRSASSSTAVLKSVSKKAKALGAGDLSKKLEKTIEFLDGQEPSRELSEVVLKSANRTGYEYSELAMRSALEPHLGDLQTWNPLTRGFEGY